MADDLIAAQPVLPTPPPGLQDYRFLAALVESLRQELIFLRTHINTHAMQGTAAEQPPADGSRRFYWVTDGTPHLEYDSGTWDSV